MADSRRSGTMHLSRSEALATLADITGRNVIVYYSGWLESKSVSRARRPEFRMSFRDARYVVWAFGELNPGIGVDLLLHSPGGDLRATSYLINHLHRKFDRDVRIIVPESAHSACAAIAFAGKELLLPAKARLVFSARDFCARPHAGRICGKRGIGAASWTSALDSVPERILNVSGQTLKKWLSTGMFRLDPEAEHKASCVLANLVQYVKEEEAPFSLSMRLARRAGLNAVPVRAHSQIHSALMNVHRACRRALSRQSGLKLIENSGGMVWAEWPASTE